MSTAPSPSHAGPRGLKFPGSSRPLKPTQTKNPPSRMKMNSVTIRNKFAGFNMLDSGRSDSLDLHGFQFDGLPRLVIRAARNFRNFCGDVHAFDDLAENRVLVVEPGSGSHGDEKLASICARTGVGHREFSRLVMFQGRMKLIPEAITWVARPGAERASSLNHELRDHAMKNQAVVKWALHF